MKGEQLAPLFNACNSVSFKLCKTMLLLRHITILNKGAKMHVTMLIKNSKGKVIQCVIDDTNKADFEALGFVDHDSKLKAKAKAKPKAKADA